MTDTNHSKLIMSVPGASGAWDWDIPNEILHVDEHFARLCDIDVREAEEGVETSKFYTAIHPDDRARLRIAVAGMLAGAEVFSKEFRMIDAEGATLWMHARGQTTFDEHDQPVRFTGLLVDITERKRTEERLRVVQSAGGIGTFEYVDGYSTATVSDEFCRLLGFHPASVLPVQTINGVTQGKAKLIPTEADGSIPEDLEAEFQVERSDNGEIHWIARRGEIVHEGADKRLIGVIYDITAAKQQEEALREWNDTLERRVEQEVAIRQQAEEALRQAQKMEAVGQLTGGIAHDFNNLLMAITSSLTLLQKRVPADPETARLIDNAQQGAQRGAALTQRMLAFARRQDLTPERIDLPRLVTGMRDLVERTIGPEWSLDLELSPQLPPVMADFNQLELALLNLTVNARDAMPDGGAIRIEAECRSIDQGEIDGLQAGTYIGLSVVDTGEGMDEDTLVRAMEPFFTTKGVGKGTGLGLSMIHGLAQQLEGGFTLKSALGQGTVATLWLPVAETAEVADVPAPRHEAPQHSGRLKVLAVDDDGLILMNTAALLEDLGHEVLEAGSGKTALALIAEHPDVDLLITDQAMPNMTGTQLATQLREVFSGLPVILASGYSDVPSGAPEGIVKLGKPFDQTMLEKAIAQVMSKGQSLQQSEESS